MNGWSEEGLTRAWRALSHRSEGENWRFVHLTRISDVSIEAGRYFPEGREALIVCFPVSWPIDFASLPEGQGFDFVRIEPQKTFDGLNAIALLRRPEGSSEIFAIMVVDVLRALESVASPRRNDLLKTFFERVREWQVFMARTRRPLSADSQIGLLGELTVLRLLMETSLGVTALECWKGPLRAAQDFHVRGGAIEVKSTLRSGAFLAHISNIEQLDTQLWPLFLCAFRFEEAEEGVSLVQTVTALRERFLAAGLGRAFEASLLIVNYFDEHAALYDRPFKVKEVRVFLSEGSMPRLTRASLPGPVRSASYVLDLDALDVPSISLGEMIKAFGLDHDEP